MMRFLLVLPWLAAAACGGGGACVDGTLALVLTPAVPTADTLRVRTTVGGATISTDTGYTGQREVSATFPGVAYAAGLHVDVLVEARKGNAVVASASATDYVLPKTCGVLALTLSTASTAFSIGGTVTGLDGTGLVLANASESLPVGASGPFTFPTLVASGQPYAVTVAAQPSAQTCLVTNASGTVDDLPISDVQVACKTNTHTVGGTVSGLLGKGLVIELDGLQDLTLAQAAQQYVFPQAVASGTTYKVVVRTQPSGPAQTCTVAHAMDTIGSTDIIDADVTCS